MPQPRSALPLAALLRHGVGIVAVVVAILLLAGPAAADRKVALLIGNAAYAAAPLANPPNDVATLRAALAAAGFDTVDARTDLGRAAMSAALDDFTAVARQADVAIVYFSGHGIEIGGVNYLVPVDARLVAERDVKFEAIPMEDVTAALAGARRLKLVLLDACRDNPFGKGGRGGATKSLGQTRGLGRVEADVADMLIAYAAAPGQVAFDGTGSISPFTAALARELVAPGVDVRLALGAVRDDVLKATGGRQQPFLTGSLGRDAILLGGPSAGAAAPPVAPAVVAPPVIAPPVAPIAPPAAPAPAKGPMTLAAVTAAGFRNCRINYADPTVYYACPSSVLPKAQGNSYDVTNLFDDAPATAWVENDPGDGIGETVGFILTGPLVPNTLEVANGYQKNADIFAKNNRVRTLAVTTSAGEAATLALRDTLGWQRFALPFKAPATWLKIEIRAVYKGTRYSDTALSGIVIR
jgi:outer membrane murein-binding lipoprotein Lpp